MLETIDAGVGVAPGVGVETGGAVAGTLEGVGSGPVVLTGVGVTMGVGFTSGGFVGGAVSVSPPPEPPPPHPARSAIENAAAIDTIRAFTFVSPIRY